MDVADPGTALSTDLTGHTGSPAGLAHNPKLIIKPAVPRAAIEGSGATLTERRASVSLANPVAAELRTAAVRVGRAAASDRHAGALLTGSPETDPRAALGRIVDVAGVADGLASALVDPLALRVGRPDKGALAAIAALESLVVLPVSLLGGTRSAGRDAGLCLDLALGLAQGRVAQPDPGQDRGAERAADERAARKAPRELPHQPVKRARIHLDPSDHLMKPARRMPHAYVRCHVAMDGMC